jgi:hypothetical protein
MADWGFLQKKYGKWQVKEKPQQPVGHGEIRDLVNMFLYFTMEHFKCIQKEGTDRIHLHLPSFCSDQLVATLAIFLSQATFSLPDYL